ncbi:hemolysin transporter protein shlB, partial [Yersinia pestis PY-48]
MACTQY